MDGYENAVVIEGYEWFPVLRIVRSSEEPDIGIPD